MTVYLKQQLEKLRDRLVVADISVVPKLQGEAQAYQRILDVLLNSRKIGQ